MKDFLRGAVRLHVLHHAAHEEIHGAWMAAELAEHGHRISPGTLYPTLHRMEEEGLLTSRDVVVEGRRRRVYRTTRAGDDVLSEMRTALAELADEVLDRRPARRSNPSTPSDREASQRTGPER